MKLPYIKKATWEKQCNPKAKWVVVDKKNKLCDVCETFGVALRYWLWHLGVSPKIAFGWFKRKKK